MMRVALGRERDLAASKIGMYWSCQHRSFEAIAQAFPLGISHDAVRQDEKRRSMVMTQTDPKTPVVDQFQGYREEFKVMGEDLVATVKNLVHESNVRRISIKHEGQTVLEIPLTVGLIGTFLAPWLAAVGAISAVLTNCTLEVVRMERPNEPPVS
jgi:hypothetical protein